MKTTRPTVSHEQLTRLFRNSLEDLPRFEEWALKNVNNLPSLSREGLRLALCGSMIEPESAMIGKGLRVAAQTRAGLFKVANANGRPVNIQLQGSNVTLAGRVAGHEIRTTEIAPIEGIGPIGLEQHLPVGPGKIDESLLDASTWVEAYYLSTLCREEGLVTSLCQTSVELLRHSTTRDPEYRYVQVDALKAFTSRAGDAESQLLTVLKALEIERPSLRKPEWALLLDKPPLELLLHVQRGDDKAFAAALPEAVKAHKKYWTKNEERRLDWDGFLSIPLLAAAALAHDRGFRFDVESEYLPMRLARGEI